MKGTERLSNAEGRKLLEQMAGNGRKGLSLPAPKVSAPKGGDHAGEATKKHKFGAKEVNDEVTGKKSSTLEDRHAREYRLMMKQGLILAYAQQVEIGLKSPRTGGYHRYVCDHLLIHCDGRQEYIDSKGVETPEFTKKANWMERQFLVENPFATFSARFRDHTHHYQAKPRKKKKP